MKRLYRNWIVIGAATAVVLLATNVALTLVNTRRLHEHAALVTHTHDVVIGLQEILSLAKDAETGQRGFLITGEAPYLAPYSTAVAAINSQVDAVERMTADNPSQQARFPELRERVARRLKILADGIAARDTVGFEAARQIVLSDRGKEEMDALRAILGEMTSHEDDLLALRERELAQTYRTAIITGSLSGLAAMLAIGGFMLLLWRHLAARSAAAFVISEQAERLRTTLASIGDAVITTDMDGRVTNMNAVAESLTGWTTSQALGQSLGSVFRIVNEETRHPVENPATRSLREGIIVGLANHTVLIARNGAERPIDDSAAPIRCKEGEIVGCVLVFRDITERKQADEMQRENERRFRVLVEQIRDYAIFMIDEQGRSTTWNEGVRRVLGFDEAEFVGQNITRIIFTPEDVQKGIPERELQEAATDGTASNTRWMRHKDGSRFFAVGATTALRDDAGALVGYMKVMRDQTEQKKMEEDLRQLAAELSDADRRKNEFLAMLAHELRNPLAPIRNAVQVIQLAKGNEQTVKSVSEMMERQIAQLVRLVDDLLDVSRITRGKIELRGERVELAKVVNLAVEAAESMFSCIERELTVKMPPQPMYLEADPTRLAQVIGNLLNNACKFTRDRGRIDLIVEREDTEAVIRIKDDGIGIAADQLPKIFDMFMQVDTTLERTVSGLGIGLTLVKNLVELHDGTVTVESAGLGHGAEFVVRLPISTERLPAPTSDSAMPRPAAVKPRNFLVVDDNRDSATSLAALLQISGNDVRIAYDGMQAVDLAEDFRPDVVLLDIGLPKLNGYEACRRIRERPWGKNMAIVAITGWGQDDDRQKSLSAGFNGHLVKPVDHTALMRLLADL